MNARAILCCLALSVGLCAQESESAAAVTAPGRKLAVALDGVLGGGGSSQEADERSLILLLDPGAALRTAAFPAELERALVRNAARLAKTKIGLAVVGVRGTLVLPFGASNARLVAESRKVLKDARDDLRNVYADIRAAAGALAGKKGRREVVLVALQNGDAEDNLESTVRELKRLNVRFLCIGSESYVADSYWTARPNAPKPSKTTLTGGDGAFVDLPWGWLFQQAVANELAPSGYGVYGFSRLARETDGRVHLYAPPNSTKHQCAIYGRCLFCDGDHAPSVDTYWRSRLGRYAPSTKDRAFVLQKAGADPWFRATLRAWKKANKAGLLRGTPAVRLAGNGLKPQRARVRPTFSWGSTNFKSQAKRADAAARECGRIFAALERDLKGLSQTKGVPRHRAVAEFTLLMLQLTKVNLVTFAGWCREIAPGLVGKATTIVPPEKPTRDAGRRPAGIGFTNYCLCHGVGPFDDVALPGGAPLRKELAVLRALADRYENLYGHTPLGVAVHRAGIAGFHLTYPGIAAKGSRRRPKSRHDKDPVTERGRPTRPGRSSGGTSGPKTGR